MEIWNIVLGYYLNWFCVDKTRDILTMVLILKIFKAIKNNNTHNILNKDYCLRLASSRVDFKTRIKKKQFEK